ncbi:hypothetical protein LJB84_00360 [Bacteroidales bacterium OttesenSCG-928-J19]|nr:hypothetical protein [Bacteroidales bacterium OttesenSCG-928-J19]
MKLRSLLLIFMILPLFSIQADDWDYSIYEQNDRLPSESFYNDNFHNNGGGFKLFALDDDTEDDLNTGDDKDKDLDNNANDVPIGNGFAAILLLFTIYVLIIAIRERRALSDTTKKEQTNIKTLN